MILQDETLLNLTEDDEKDASSLAPPTKVVTVKQHFTSADHNEMLSLAQQKFDQLRKKNKERVSSVRYGRTVTRKRSNDSQEELKTSQLLSSLLYLSLMMHRVDDMKKILETSDSTLYNEWYSLLDILHSPIFHLCERRLHNDRAKKFLNRKRKYRELYEQAKASLATMEATSSELSQALSRMSEQNLKSQALLEKNNGVEAKLCGTVKEVENLQERLERQEKDNGNTKSECKNLESMLKGLEIERAKFIQEVQAYKKSTDETAKELAELKTNVGEKERKLSIVEQTVVAAEKDKDSLQKQLQMEAVSHERILEEKEKQIQLLEASIENLQSSLDKLGEEMTESKIKIAAEKDELQQPVSDAKKEVDGISAKLQSSQEALDSARSEMVSKGIALEKAIEASRCEQNNGMKLREMIVTKDGEINRSSDKSRSMEIKLIKTENDAKCAAGIHEEHTSKLKERMSYLEQKIKDSETKTQRLTEDNSNVLASEVKLREEKTSLESLVAVTRKDHEHSEDKCKGLETKLSEQEIAFKEYEKGTNDKFNALSKESTIRAAENKRLSEMLGTMQNSMEQSAQSASKSKESVEEKADETERELLDMTLKLVKAQAENDILKSSTLSVTKTLADAQAKVVSDERETSLLRSSIEELKTESCQLSQKIDSMRESLMKDAKTALEKQISAEMKAADLHTQLDRERVANKPVSHNVASSELIGAIPEDVQNLENNDHSRDLSCIRTLEKSESLNSEHGTLMPKDERIVKKSVLSNPSTSNEQDYARILVTGVMSTAVKNSCR